MRQTFFAFSFLLSVSLLTSFSLATSEEFGKAGYYADSLHGRKTASGEKYDKNELTCAHKSLPFGTKVRVTRLDNKKSVVVKVNDRGPFVEGYVVDISRKAAEEIGLIKDGVTRVKVEVVEASSTARVAAETDGNAKLLVARETAKQTAKATPAATNVVKPLTYSTDDPEPARKAIKINSELLKIDLKKSEKVGFGVQVSTIYDANNLLPVVKKLQGEWPGKSLVLMEKNETDETTTYKVIVGPFVDKKTATSQQKLAAKKGYKGCFVVDLGSI